MQSEKSIIVFIKNLVLNKVKTRLAKTTSPQIALQVYKKLIFYTIQELEKLFNTNIYYYFSNYTEEIYHTRLNNLYVQKGNTLGERMMNAFQEVSKY